MVATSGKGWKLAPSLVDLIEEVDARWPKRDKSSDGSIGDQAHASRTSEHNPDHDADPMPTGYVSAVDITKDSASMMETVRKALVGDSRVWYVIHNGYIWSRTHNWEKREYDGSNPHTKHLHVSLRQTATAAADTSSWGIANAPAPTPTPAPKPTLVKLAAGVKPGKRHTQVKLLQSLLIKAGYGPIRGAITNFYGENTEAAVRRFHKANPRFAEGPADSKIGPLGFAELQREAAARK